MVRERVLLFCLASGTPWQKADVTERTVLNMVIRGMVERQFGAHLSLTRQGREALAALLAAELGAGSRNFACVSGSEPGALTLSYPRMCSALCHAHGEASRLIYRSG